VNSLSQWTFRPAETTEVSKMRAFGWSASSVHPEGTFPESRRHPMLGGRSVAINRIQGGIVEMSEYSAT